MENKVSRSNPMVSFVVSPEEMRTIKSVSNRCGISLAQAARAFFRRGISKSLDDLVGDKNFIEIARKGSFHTSPQ